MPSNTLNPCPYTKYYYGHVITLVTIWLVPGSKSVGKSHSICLSSEACAKTIFHHVLLYSRAHLPPAGRTGVVFRIVTTPAICIMGYVYFDLFYGQGQT